MALGLSSWRFAMIKVRNHYKWGLDVDGENQLTSDHDHKEVSWHSKCGVQGAALSRY